MCDCSIGRSTGVVPFDASHIHAIRFAFLFLLLGPCHTLINNFFTAGWHAAWVNRKKVGSKDRRQDEMLLTNVTAYQVSMHDTCHVVLCVRTVTVPNAHFQ